MEPVVKHINKAAILVCDAREALNNAMRCKDNIALAAIEGMLQALEWQLDEILKVD